MKKYFKYLLIVVISLFSVNVEALAHKTVEIFPVGETATVTTETFEYTNFVYVPAAEGSKFGTMEFESVTNKTDKTIPLSINILMFDKNKKNIGFLTYCSLKDISGDYAQMKIKANASSEFSFNVTDTYFAGGSTAKDIAYLAVLDDNKYCQIGGYDKYAGQTIEEISHRNSPSQNNDNKSFDISKLNLGKWVPLTIIVSIIVIGGKVILGKLSSRNNGNGKRKSYVQKNNFNENDQTIDRANDNLELNVMGKENNSQDNNKERNVMGRKDYNNSELSNFSKDDIKEDMINLNYDVPIDNEFDNSNTNNFVNNDNLIEKDYFDNSNYINDSNDNNDNSNAFSNSNNINSNSSNSKNNEDGESDLAKFFK